jgi:hypothetical protein
VFRCNENLRNTRDRLYNSFQRAGRESQKMEDDIESLRIKEVNGNTKIGQMLNKNVDIFQTLLAPLKDIVASITNNSTAMN